MQRCRKMKMKSKRPVHAQERLVRPGVECHRTITTFAAFGAYGRRSRDQDRRAEAAKNNLHASPNSKAGDEPFHIQPVYCSRYSFNIDRKSVV